MFVPRSLLRAAVLCSVASTLLGAPAAWAACYVVYNSEQQVVYRAQTPPVDLSKQLHETVPAIAPGGALVFSLDNGGCEREFDRLTPAAVQAHAAAELVRRSQQQ